jgi:hypothetical protein
MTSVPTTHGVLEEQLGLSRIAHNLQSVVKLGETVVMNAPRKIDPCCAWDAGSLSRCLPPTQPSPHLGILFDIGGTHTKVAARTPSGEWALLFDHLNDWFQPRRDTTLSPLRGFFRVIIEELLSSLPTLKTQKMPLRIAVIWSNQIETKRFAAGSTSGVTGVVHGFQNGSYRKGEWFLKEISNGDDLGALLLAELAHAGLSPERLVIGNDTIFTLFAVPGAHSGVVVSSGGNCTLVGTDDSDRDELYNSELGALFSLPHSALSLGDKAFAKSREVLTLSLEELSAGNWFPQMLSAHVITAAKLPAGVALSPIAKAIESNELRITNAALCRLIESDSDIFNSFTDDSRMYLRALTISLVRRAAMLAGIMTYLSVVNQLKAGLPSASVSLDSSMSRYFPGYFDHLKECVASITPRGREVRVSLVHPIQLAGGGDISVPLQGAALALAAQ